MTDDELIKQTRAKFEQLGVPFGEFWTIMRSATSLTTVWFWGEPKGSPNYSCQFDEKAGQLLWCNV